MRTLTTRTAIVAAFASTLASVLLGTTTSAAAQPSANPRFGVTASDSSFTALEATARHDGTVPVVVILDAPPLAPAPKGTGATPATAAKASAATAGATAARDRLLAAFRGKTPRGLRALAGAPFVSLHADPSDLAVLASAPGVKSVVRDRVFSLEATTTFGGEAGVQLPLWWQRNQIGLDWTTTNRYLGTGQTVVVIDTGVDSTHAWLKGRVVTEACFATNTDGSGACNNGQTSQYSSTYAGVPGAASPCAYSFGCAHGTHVAHIAAGAYGAASGAQIIAIKAAHPERNATGQLVPLFSWSDLTWALWYVYNPLPSIPAAINISVGSDNGTTANCDTDPSMSTMASYVTALKRDYRIATVIASGNSNFRDGVSYPACISTAVVVGNTTLTSASGTDAVFGNMAGGSNSGPQVDLLAPGTDICSAVPVSLDNDGVKDGRDCTYVGTSMAAPAVAGAFAVMRQSRPAATVDQILSALQRRGAAVTDTRDGLVRSRISISNAVYYW